MLRDPPPPCRIVSPVCESDWVIEALFRYSYLWARGVSESKKLWVWMDLNSSKIQPKIVKNPGLGGLGVAWGVFGEIWARISRKIVSSYAQEGVGGALSWSKSGSSWPMLALRWRLGA